MKIHALIAFLFVGFFSLLGCSFGTHPPQHYPAGLSQQDAMKQRYECEREAEQAIPAPMIDTDSYRWLRVAEMRNVCLAAKGWTE